jgi:hypothetical protein
MAKYGLEYYKAVNFHDFTTPQKFERVKEHFYKQNIFGFDKNDIKDNAKITINEFNSDKNSEPPFQDSAPETVEKEFHNDYLIPSLKRIEIKYAGTIFQDYNENINHTDRAIINFKERHLERLDEEERLVRENNILGGAKRPLLDAIQRLKSATESYYKLYHTLNPEDNKIKINLNKKELAQFLVVLKKDGVFGQELTNANLAEIGAIHFMYRSGGTYNIIEKRSMEKEIGRATSTTFSDRLEQILKNYKKNLQK